MASRKMFFRSKPNHIHPTKDNIDDGSDPIINLSSDDHHDVFEFDEADVWNYNSANEARATMSTQDGKKPILLPSAKAWSKKLSRKIEILSVDHKSTQKVASANSLPVNVPDWSQILKAGYKEHGGGDKVIDDGNDDGDRDGRIPPHEYLAIKRGVSFSVHEGIGRTLKGRDLRCVRNAVWKKTGFED